MEKLGSMPLGLKKGKNYSSEAESEGKKKGSFVDHTGKQYLDKWVEIINGVEYVIYLEYGHSKVQAPYGMVRISMRELRKGKLPEEMSKELRKAWRTFSPA
jgi:hypothetical protein